MSCFAQREQEETNSHTKVTTQAPHKPSAKTDPLLFFVDVRTQQSLLCWLGKERLRSHFNRLFRLGVKEVRDIVEAQSQRILGFVEARHLLRIPPNYGFIWQQLQNIPVI